MNFRLVNQSRMVYHNGAAYSCDGPGDYEVKNMEYVNEAGFEEWWTTDRKGRRVSCYANKYVELHIKRPVCECGRILGKAGKNNWRGSRCGAEYSYDEIYRAFSPDAYDYDCDSGTIQDDYGERKYEELPMECGPSRLYFEYADIMNNP